MKGVSNVMEEKEKNPIQSAERIFSILEMLADNGPMGIADLSEKLFLNKSTVHRMLRSLGSMGYVSQDEETSKYHLTLKIVNISGKVLKQVDLISIAQPYLKALMEKTQETIHLLKRVDDHIVFISKLSSAKAGPFVQLSSYIGMTCPLYSTSAGKAILATLPDDQIYEYLDSIDLKKITDNTITDREALMDEIRGVRLLGYALDNEENEIGVKCIAGSIRNYTGHAEYAISISCPVSRLTEQRIAELAPMIKETCMKLGRELGVG